jgi:hypothetical protein
LAFKDPVKKVVIVLVNGSLDIFQSAKDSNMTNEQFLEMLQAHAESFAKAVATNEGEWIVKGFIDVYRRVYTFSVDTKIV